MSAPSPLVSRRVIVLHLGPHFRLTCRCLSMTGTKPRRVFSGHFEPSSEEAFSALAAFAESRPLGRAVPIIVVDLGDEKVVTVLYAFSRKFTAMPAPVDSARASFHPVELIFEEIQPRDELSYVVIDEKTDFRASDYQSCLDRLRQKETPCPTKP